MKTEKIYQGNCIDVLKDFPDESIDCVCTSPPYLGLRDYGTAEWEGGDENCKHIKKTQKQGGEANRPSRELTIFQYDKKCKDCGAIRKDSQLGLEETPEEFVANLVKVFSEVKRVLKKEGTVWLNLGDTYSATRWSNTPSTTGISTTESDIVLQKKTKLPDKNLVGIPWRVAFALQSDGWYLRQDIIWHKPNPMPESVQDRCTKSHEYIFLLTKSPKYFYDIDAIREPFNDGGLKRINQNIKNQIGSERGNGGARLNGNMKAVSDENKGANKRSVWSITTKPYKEAHFATFPIELPTYCIKAGCPEKVCKKCKKPIIKESYRENKLNVGYGNQHTPSGTHKKIGGKYQKFMEENPKKIIEKPTCSCNAGFEGGVVLDPFFGSGTTGLAAQEQFKHWVGIELNPEYIEIANRRLAQKTLFV